MIRQKVRLVKERIEGCIFVDFYRVGGKATWLFVSVRYFATTELTAQVLVQSATESYIKDLHSSTNTQHGLACF